MRVCLSLLLLTAAVGAQSRLFDYDAAGLDRFGRVVSGAGDIDADGVDDVLVSAPGQAVRAISGSDGRLLLQIPAPAGEPDFGATTCALDDIDADGFDDFALAIPQADGRGPGLVLVVSGRDGRTLRVHAGDRLGDRAGAALLAVPDLDRDGVSELAIGLPGHDNVAEDAGLVRVFSGRTGQPLLYRPGAAPGERFGCALVVAGDWNRDQVVDLAIGANGGDLVRVISTADAKTLATLSGPAGSEFGSALATADLDGAEPLDLCVAAPGFTDVAGHRGQLSAWAGGTGKLLYRVDGPLVGDVVRTLRGTSPGEWFGRSLAAVGDLDADGHEELWVGAPLAGPTLAAAGEARLISGKDGSVLFTIPGEAKNDFFGQVVGRAGDVDRDGVDDLLATAMGGGYVKLLSGKTGSTLRRIAGDPKSYFGGALAGAVDLDGDGVPDQILAAPLAQNGAGRVDWISGKTGGLIKTLGGAPGARFGTAVAAAGDIDDDGRDDVLIGAPGENGGLGAVYVLSGRTGAALTKMSGNSQGDEFGAAVAALARGPDDGSEVLIGAPGNGTGYIERRLARDGSLLATVTGTSAGDAFGSSLAPLAFRGDRVRFAVGAPMTGVSSGAGYVRVFEDNTVVLERTGDKPGDQFGHAVVLAGGLAVAAPSAAVNGQVVVHSALDPAVRLGEALASAGDTNADQIDDLVVGEPGLERARVLSGRDGHVLFEIQSQTRGFGISVATADVNADASLDLVVGTTAGTASVHASRDLALAYDLHRLSLSQGGRQRLDLDFGATAAGKLYTTVGTLSGIHPGVPLPGGHLAINPDAYTVFTLASPSAPPLVAGRGFLDATGRATAGFAMPPGLDPRLLGLAVHHAVLVFGFTFQVDAVSNSAPLLFGR